VIPYAEVLSPGTLALTYGNYQEPQLGVAQTQQNFSLGVGLMPYVEFFGRFAEYTNPKPGSIFVNGIRDISANLKVQLPTLWRGGPKLAVGMNDVSGGAAHFKSAYAVVSDQYGPVRVAVGYAQGKAVGSATFDGAFAGLNVRLTDNGLSGLLEHEAQQNHVGLRWLSSPLASFGNSRIVGSVQSSFGGSGLSQQSSRFAVSLVMPLGENDQSLADFQVPAGQALPALDSLMPSADAADMQPTAQDRLESLRQALVAVGLERVKVGVSGTSLVVEYENHRYAQNEVDALGLVFGLAVEMAPKGSARVLAVTLKDGLALYETSVDAASYREFLRNGSIDSVRSTLMWRFQPTEDDRATQWIETQASFASPVRFEIKPDLNYTFGTEIGAFDYSLAANVQATVPLWRGANAYATYAMPVANSSNMDAGGAFNMYRQSEGLKTLALQQSYWVGNRILTQVAAGRFEHGAIGVQAEATALVPGRSDVIRVRGAGYDRVPGGLIYQDRAFSASYRLMASPASWLEFGANQYTDGSQGPSVEWTRWFGDMSVQLFYRKGGDHQFAGLQLSFPLTPRQGMLPGPAFFSGPAQYSQGFRTRMTTASSLANNVVPGAVTSLKFDTSLDDSLRNSGRMNLSYISSQLGRMRNAFFIFSLPKEK
jgi:hypothetical protein